MPITSNHLRINVKIVFSLIFIFNFSSRLIAEDFYWVGGGGKWSELQHWVSTSGGTDSRGRVPGPTDNVYFDVNSGFGTTALSRTIIVDAALIYCKDMIWDGAPNNPYFNGNNQQLQIHGSLQLQPTMIFAINILNFRSNNISPGETIQTFGALGYTGYYGVGNIIFDGDGIWTLMDDLTTGQLTNTQIMHSYVYLNSGTFNLNGHTVTTGKFNSVGNGMRTLNMENSTFKLLLGGQSNGAMGFAWDVTGSNKTILTDNSTIAFQKIINAYDFKAFNADGDMYDTIILTDPNGLFGIFDGTATINRLELFGNSTLNGNLTIGDFIMHQGRKTQFADGSIQTILNHIDIASTCNPVSIVQSKSGIANIELSPSATYHVDYVFFKGMNVSGQTFDVSHSTDGGDNSGITFLPSFSVSGNTMYWIGGAGNWNDGNHWSKTSGGTPFGCSPTISHDVVFDANSGFQLNDTVRLDGTDNFCKNMTWNNAPNHPILVGERQHLLNVYGSMYLQTDMDYAVHTTYFLAKTLDQEIDTKGIPFGIPNHPTYIGRAFFNGDGGWKFLNSFITGGSGGEQTTRGSILFEKGTLNTNGQLVDICSFTATDVTAQNSSPRNLILGNSHIYIHNNSHNDKAWLYMGTTNKTLDAGTSTIEFVGVTTTTLHSTFSDNGISQYHNLIFSAANPITTTLNGYGGVTANKVIFKGNAKFYLKSTDTLILSGSKVYEHSSGTLTINKLFSAETPTCETPIIFTENASASVKIAVTPTTVVRVDGVSMTNIIVIGGPITALNSFDNGGNSGINFIIPASKTLYWVNGAGDWNDQNHWSASSGGVGGYCIPTMVDDVIFDNLSGLSGNDIVNLDGTLQLCRDLSWDNTLGHPIFYGDNANVLRVYGSFLLQNNMMYEVTNTYFMSNDATPKMVNTAGVIIGKTIGNFIFNGNGMWEMQSDIELKGNGVFTFTKGTMATNDYGIKAFSFSSTNSGVRNINLGSSQLYFSSAIYPWLLQGTNITLNAGTSTINMTGSTSASSVGNFRCTPNERYYHVAFTAPTANGGSLNGGANIQRLTFASHGVLYANNTIDSLILKEGKVYKLAGGKTQTVNQALILLSTPCIFTTLTSIDGSQANLRVMSGNTKYEFAVVSNIKAVNPIQFDYSNDQGGNTNINFHGSQTSLQSLSAVVNVPMCAYPITLDVSDFIVGNSSNFYWDGGITDNQITITENGVHYLHMEYNAGCNLSEKIDVTCPLPVELTDFHLENDQCDVRVDWTTASEVNNDYFEIYRSQDGIDWQRIAQERGAGNSNQTIHYSYMDNSIHQRGIYYYYLKQIDFDNNEKAYPPKAIEVNSCEFSLEVYPNPTNQFIHVTSSVKFNSYTIVDALGRIVATQKLSQAGNQLDAISIVDLADGVYSIQISLDGEQVQTTKFIVQK